MPFRMTTREIQRQFPHTCAGAQCAICRFVQMGERQPRHADAALTASVEPLAMAPPPTTGRG